MKLYVVDFTSHSNVDRLSKLLDITLSKSLESKNNIEVVRISSAEEFYKATSSGSLKGCPLFFAVSLDKGGFNRNAYETLSFLNSSLERQYLSGCFGAVAVDGQGEMFTKDIGRRLVFAANLSGCAFPGKPLVEATGSLANFKVLAKLQNTTLEKTYEKSLTMLIEKLLSFAGFLSSSGDTSMSEKPKILAIHAGNKTTSNSYLLWKMVSEDLGSHAEIEEISIRNGELTDCRGCKYEDCLHFGEKGRCFYGGVMTDKVYPAIINCDILMLICPNYNDSVTANIMAFINRLTSVFRAHDFSRKKIFSIIVSGYSGGDIVAQQIIGAINMNKNFVLPSSFAMIETANKPKEILNITDIKEKAAKFAANILQSQYNI
ncbi:MAG: flavodoxin family protein [Firmicutes bacterium]|nr:flavodoxin family protein [Bacillota bacterium]